jgi:hypothetical protein
VGEEEEDAVVEVLEAVDWVFGAAEGFDDGEGGLLDGLFAVALCARKATNKFARNGLLVGMALSSTSPCPFLLSFLPSS